MSTDAHKNLKGTEMANIFPLTASKTKTNFTTLIEENAGSHMVPPKVPAFKMSSWGRRFKVFLRTELSCFCLLTMALPVLTSNHTRVSRK